MRHCRLSPGHHRRPTSVLSSCCHSSSVPKPSYVAFRQEFRKFQSKHTPSYFISFDSFPCTQYKSDYLAKKDWVTGLVAVYYVNTQCLAFLSDSTSLLTFLFLTCVLSPWPCHFLSLENLPLFFAQLAAHSVLRSGFPPLKWHSWPGERRFPMSPRSWSSCLACFLHIIPTLRNYLLVDFFVH